MFGNVEDDGGLECGRLGEKLSGRHRERDYESKRKTQASSTEALMYRCFTENNTILSIDNNTVKRMYILALISTFKQKRKRNFTRGP